MIEMKRSYSETFGRPRASAVVEFFARRRMTNLPQAYVDFLCEHNGGVPLREDFDIPGHGSSVIAFFHAVAEEPQNVRTFGYAFGVFDDVIRRGRLPIATDWFGNLVCINTRRGGAICFWDHETNDVHPVAKGFTEFVAGLRSNSGGAPDMTTPAMQ